MKRVLTFSLSSTKDLTELVYSSTVLEGWQYGHPAKSEYSYTTGGTASSLLVSEVLRDGKLAASSFSPSATGALVRSYTDIR